MGACVQPIVYESESLCLSVTASVRVYVRGVVDSYVRM